VTLSGLDAVFGSQIYSEGPYEQKPLINVGE